MKPVRTYRLTCLSEALSPITHMMGTSGNESIINREYVYTQSMTKAVPVLSGNAIRHRMVREPGAMYLIRQYDLEGQMSIDMANFLLVGGSLSQSSISDNLRQIAQMQTLFPLLRLLGGSLTNQVVGGSLYVLRGVMLCEENRRVLSRMLPDGYDLPNTDLRSCEEYVSEYQYTRGDARRLQGTQKLLSVPDVPVTPTLAADGFVDDLLGEKSNLMLYSGQTVKTGAMFLHGFYCQNISRLELGALYHALALWEQSGSTIGGQARIGHGRIQLSMLHADGKDFYGTEIDPAECVTAYIEHVQQHRDDAVDWLQTAFPLKESRKKAKAVDLLLGKDG